LTHVFDAANVAFSYVVPFAILPLFLPNGHLPHPLWRPVLWLTTLAITVQTVSTGVELVRYSEESAPPSETDQLYQILYQLDEHIALAVLIGEIAALLSLLHRWVSTRGAGRAQVAWVTVAVSAAFLGRMSWWYMAPILGDPSWFALYLPRVVGLVVFVVACGVAILRHDLVLLNPLLWAVPLNPDIRL
jgi:hypothetical protein